MTQTMQATYLSKERKIYTAQVPIPVPEPDQVLVKVASVGVCGSDVHYFKHGAIGHMVVEDDLILGHELSGVITAVGSDVSPDRIGQRVAVEPQRACRVCAQCKAGRYNLCPDIEFFATPPIHGAFAQYVTIQSDFAYQIPDHVSFGAAAMIEPLSVAIATARKAGITTGSRVLIAGAGPIGVIMAQTARAFGASEIYITDVAEDRRTFALKHGATHALDAATADLNGLDVDVFVDASGVASAVYNGIKAVGPNGRAVLVGMGADDVLLPVSYIQWKEITVTGIFRYANTWPLGIELVASGKVDLDVVITH
ncbi:MAG: NAD(P)-dependent alcohol dehydrogenase, partial [Micrococcales bacterium]